MNWKIKKLPGYNKQDFSHTLAYLFLFLLQLVSTVTARTQYHL